MLGDFTCRIALQVLGYVYPAYRTYKVVQLPATRANDTLLRKWCCYWCLIAALTAVQPLLDTFLFWIPFYFEAKLALAVYLWANDLAGAQYVYVRWFQPLVASYEPLVDRRLAESKALSSEWLHSNALRLVAAMQQRTLAWLASLQLQAAEAAGGGALPAAPAVRRPAPIVEELESDEEEEVVVVRETRSRRRAAVPAPKRASSRGGRGEGERAGASARGDAYAVPGDELQSRRSSFSLATFFSARSSDLQQQDLKVGLKAFPVLVQGEDSPPRC